MYKFQGLRATSQEASPDNRDPAFPFPQKNKKAPYSEVPYYTPLLPFTHEIEISFHGALSLREWTWTGPGGGGGRRTQNLNPKPQTLTRVRYYIIMLQSSTKMIAIVVRTIVIGMTGIVTIVKSCGVGGLFSSCVQQTQPDGETAFAKHKSVSL